MGLNTTVVVINDELDQIENDPNFGKNLVEAIRELPTGRKNIDVRAGNCVNAASVVESHHADFDVLVKVGGNLGEIVRAT